MIFYDTDHPRPLIITDNVVTGPTVPPLTLAYAKSHIRALGNVDDHLTAVYILAAASYFEEQTGRQIMTATREAWLDAFPFLGAAGRAARIQLPKPPLQAVISVKYLDTAGAVRSFDDGGSPATPFWVASAPAGDYATRGSVEPIYGSTWPIARDQTDAVKIQYRAGYASDPDTVPELIRGVLCYLVSHFDTFRGAVHEARRGQVLELPFGVQAMLDGFKLTGLSTEALREFSRPGWAAWPGGAY